MLRGERWREGPCEGGRERERERVRECVCVCVRERERESPRLYGGGFEKRTENYGKLEGPRDWRGLTQGQKKGKRREEAASEGGG